MPCFEILSKHSKYSNSMHVFVLTIFIVINTFICSVKCLELSQWTLSNENGSIVVKNITTPNDVYSILFEHSLIGWPLTGYNDVVYRWIAYDNWTFTSAAFAISPSNQTILSLSQLDVYPRIFLNGKIIPATVSEFNSVDILINSSHLKCSNNILQLKFTSPPMLAKQRSDSYKSKIPPECWPKLFNGECHINMLRKTQSSFGWDWGPAIPTMGISGKVELRSTNKISAVIKGVRFLTKSDENCRLWHGEVSVKLLVVQDTKTSRVCVTMTIKNLDIKLTDCIETNDGGTHVANFNFNIDSPRLKLWWPHEMGTPSAYKLEVNVLHYNLVLDRTIDYVGFRRVSLDQSAIPGHKGRLFRFNVNCRQFFVKGTNWVPRTYLSSEWTNESYLEFLLTSLVEANINTIRVWGGGRPESKSFYNIADRLGIMIWHDLMFAGSLYPDDEGFLTEVYLEVSDLLWSLQKHPSILLWSGNNEIELAIAAGWYNTSAMDPHNVASYYRLFVKFIKPLITSLDPVTPFVLSSPSNGIESEKIGGVAANPQSHYFGDVHFYLYSNDVWDENSYPITRMTTEFGFQSYPSTETWAQIILNEEDFEPNGALANHRQHLVGGFNITNEAIIGYFGKSNPIGNHNVRETYSWFSYLSQINQAIILMVHINRLRSSQCSITSTGEGYTSGAMYWQLNDNWITPSWSTIEANSQWKLGHYFIKRAFTKERIIVAINDSKITVRIILPEMRTSTKYNAILTCIDFSKVANASVTGTKNISINPADLSCNVSLILSIPITLFLKDCKCETHINCIVEGRLMGNGKPRFFDTTTIVRPKHSSLPIEARKDEIKLKIRNATPDLSVCLITLSAQYVHLFVTLTTTSMGRFTDNGFHMWQNNLNVTFNPWYHQQSNFFNCSLLKVKVTSLNPLLS